MTPEDSKELAEAGSFGLRLRFRARSPTTGAEMGRDLGSALCAGAKTLVKGGALLGHVKAVAKTRTGFVKVSVVDLRLGPELDTDMPEGMAQEGSINIMAAAAGHTDLEVRTAVESMAEALSRRFELEHEGREKGSKQVLELG